MKKLLFLICLLPLSLWARETAARQTKVAILSTNDIHAQIQHFPQFATAVELCRDTIPVILVDAGDRWTGNVYVDRSPGRLPIIELMNKIGYDAATLGNHEFDEGEGTLHRSMAAAKFPILCANMEGEASHTYITRDGVRFGVVSVVTNHDGGHPVGNEAVYAGMTFTDPVESLVEPQGVANDDPACAMLIGLAHMDQHYVQEAARKAPRYDLIVGGHDHKEYIERIGRTYCTETGCNLNNVGVCIVTFEQGVLANMECRNVPTAGYEAHPEYQVMVDRYFDNPELSAVIGHLHTSLDKQGVTMLMLESIRERAKADAAFYHGGGVRLDSLAAGDVHRADMYNLEPFSSTIATARMTPAQMRRAILARPNSTFTSVPHELVRDTFGHVVDVLFPTLKEGRKYRVAMGDYMFNKQPGLEYTQGKVRDWLITDALETYVTKYYRGY